MRRPNPEPGFGLVPHYVPVEPPPPTRHPTLRLSAADAAVLDATTFDQLDAALHLLLEACYRQRRAKFPALVETTTLVRLNGLLALARRMTRGLRRPVGIPDLPETRLLGAAELIPALEAAVFALACINDHRGQPRDPAFRGRPHPWVDPVAVAHA